MPTILDLWLKLCCAYIFVFTVSRGWPVRVLVAPKRIPETDAQKNSFFQHEAPSTCVIF